MRTPGLRLRQVFEHTNHFKVQKPTGETITIAKKGLSPSTVGRLRRFAQGGEVRNYQVGGEVEDGPDLTPEEAKQQAEAEAFVQRSMPQWSETPETPVEQEIPRTSRRVVTAAENKAALAELAAQRAAPTRPVAPPPAPVAAPAPVSVVVNTAPAPVAPQAPISAPVVAPEAATPAPQETASAPATTVEATSESTPKTEQGVAAPVPRYQKSDKEKRFFAAMNRRSPAWHAAYDAFMLQGAKPLDAFKRTEALAKSGQLSALDSANTTPPPDDDKITPEVRAHLKRQIARMKALRAADASPVSTVTTPVAPVLNAVPPVASPVAPAVPATATATPEKPVADELELSLPDIPKADRKPRPVQEELELSLPDLGAPTKQSKTEEDELELSIPEDLMSPRKASSPEPTPAAPAPVVAASAPTAAAPIAPLSLPTLSDVSKARQLSANTGKPIGDVIATLMPNGDDPGVRLALASIAPPKPDATKSAIDNYDAAVSNYLSAVDNKAKIDKEVASGELELARRQYARELEQSAIDKDNAEKLSARRAAMEKDFKDGLLDIKSFSDSVGLPKTLLSLFALAIGGYASGYTNTPNYAYKAFEDAIAKDLEEQKHRRTSKYNEYVRLLGDEEQAKKLLSADLKDLAALEVSEMKLRYAGPAAEAAAAQVSSKLMLDATKDRAEVLRKDAQARRISAAADREKELADLMKKKLEAETAAAEALANQRNAAAARSRAPAAPKPVKPGQETLGAEVTSLEIFEKLPAIEQRKQMAQAVDPQTGANVEFPVVGIRMQAPTIESIKLRQGALEQAQRALTLIKKNPTSLDPQTAEQIKTALTRFLTEYPSSNGVKRILPLADKDLVSKRVFAFTSDALSPAKAYDTLGTVRTALAEFKRSIAEGIYNEIKSSGISGHKGTETLLRSYEKALHGSRGPLKPAE